LKKKLELIINEIASINDLDTKDRELINAAMDAADKAYAPYSGFNVGAALRLDDGSVVAGNNRENAAFPSGICAERTAISYAGANYPEQKIETIAICAKTEKGFTSDPVPPCGTCRQVIAEEEDRNANKIRLLLFGSEKIQVVDGISMLLPLHFDKNKLKG
jgi:cytidine deaminase